MTIARLKELERISGTGFLTRPTIIGADDYHEFSHYDDKIATFHSSGSHLNKANKSLLPLVAHFEIGDVNVGGNYPYGALFYSPRALGAKFESHDNQCALVLYALKTQAIASGKSYQGREQEFWLDIEKKHICDSEKNAGIYIFQDKDDRPNFRAQVKRLYGIDLGEELTPSAPKKRARYRQP